MMDCPKCFGKTTVYGTCMLTIDNELPRKRKCLECGHRFITLETIIKKDGDANDNKSKRGARA